MPRLLVTLSDDGVGVTSDGRQGDVDLKVIDYNVGDLARRAYNTLVKLDLLSSIPQSDGTYSEAIAGRPDVKVDAEWVDKVWAATPDEEPGPSLPG